jgi:hypothetical protein
VSFGLFRAPEGVRRHRVAGVTALDLRTRIKIKIKCKASATKAAGYFLLSEATKES